MLDLPVIVGLSIKFESRQFDTIQIHEVLRPAHSRILAVLMVGLGHTENPSGFRQYAAAILVRFRVIAGLYVNQLISVYSLLWSCFQAWGVSMKRVAIYLRVSTSKQETGNQRRELEAVAERSGWQVVKVYEDAGISGAKGRDKRPGLDAMMKGVNAKEFDMVATWSVDRLGRSLTDLLAILQGLQEKGIDLFLHQQGLDTSTTAGKAMFQMLGVFAEFERGIIRERVNAGLARAKANGVKLGRRRVKPSVEAQILELRAKGDGILKIGKKLGVGTSVVQRVFKQELWQR